MLAYYFLFFSLGFFSLVAQTLALREFAVSFGSSELGLALFFFFWLFWAGAGAKLARPTSPKSLRLRRPSRFLFAGLCVYPLLAFAQMSLLVGLRGFCGLKAWEFFDFGRLFISLAVVTSFFSLVTGAIFTTIADLIKGDSRTVSRAFFYDALGGFFAGCLTTLLILAIWPAQTILSLAAVLFYATVFFVAIRLKKTLVSVCSILALVLFLVLSAMPGVVGGFWQNQRLKNIFPQGAVIEETFTPYRHLFFVRMDQIRTALFSGGRISQVFPENADSDAQASMLIAQADNPGHLVVLGTGAHNLVRSLLKFPLESLAWVMEDRRYYEAVARHLPQDYGAAFSDPRLRLVFEQERDFLQRNKTAFDLVAFAGTDPDSLLADRFFTKEFYQLVKDSLAERGLFACRITSGENYLAGEQGNYGASVYATLSSVFPKVAIVAGESSWFFSGNARFPAVEDPAILADRLRSVPARLEFKPEAFYTVLEAKRSDFSRQAYAANPLVKTRGLLDSDQRPLAFFLYLLVLAQHSSPAMAGALKAMFLAGPLVFVLPMGIFFLARIWFLRKFENLAGPRQVFHAGLFEGVSGFCAFSMHLVFLFLFQNRFGTMFALVGFLNALFMLGLFSGSRLGLVLISGPVGRDRQTLFIWMAATLAGLAALAGLVMVWGPQHLPQPVFMILFALCGCLGGMSYPLAGKVWEVNAITVDNTAAGLQLLDYWGGALAGLLSGFLMLPALGTHNTFLTIMALMAFTIALLAGELRPARERKAGRSILPYIKLSLVMAAVGVSLLACAFLVRHNAQVLSSQPPQPGIYGGSCEFDPVLRLTVCDSDQGKQCTVLSKDFAPDIRGFGGPINIVLSFGSDRKIREVVIAEHKETTPYLAKISDMLKILRGRRLDDPGLVQGVDTVSGATITSQAVIAAVDKTAKQAARSLGQNVAASKGREDKLVWDKACLYLLAVTVLALVLYFVKTPALVRRAYLILVVLAGGVMFNLVFGPAHLAKILCFDFFGPPVLSQTLVLFLPLALGIFFGRFWCGWLCPFGAIQELFGSGLAPKKISPRLDRKARYFKYILLFLFVVAIAFKGEASGFDWEPLSTFFFQLSWQDALRYVGYAALIFSLFWPRFWCRYFCFCGAFFSFFNRIAIARRFLPKMDRVCCLGAGSVRDIDCIECGRCKHV